MNTRGKVAKLFQGKIKQRGNMQIQYCLTSADVEKAIEELFELFSVIEKPHIPLEKFK